MIGNSNSLKCLNYHSFIEICKSFNKFNIIGQISHQTKQKIPKLAVMD